jgi:hypothetical protein
VQVTFILDAQGRSEYFRTRGFVAPLLSKQEADPGDGRGRGGRRTLSLAVTPARSKPVLLPEPALPFINPPARE